jgi:hypothetical protein
MSVIDKPNQTFEFNVMNRGSYGTTLAGLPPHLQVLKDGGRESSSLRRQFYKGKASRKKRGK